MVTLTCEECGCSFERHEANERQRVREGRGGPYCSPGCFHESQRGQETVSLTCVECDETFERPKHRETEARRESRKAGPFCSKPCTSRYYAKKNKPWEAKQDHVIDRFMDKWKYDEGCWRWTASLDGKGYGQIKDGETPSRAHHISFEVLRGRPVRDGLQLHHICENRRCVNPLHLVEVSQKEHYNIHAGGKSR